MDVESGTGISVWICEGFRILYMDMYIDIYIIWILYMYMDIFVHGSVKDSALSVPGVVPPSLPPLCQWGHVRVGAGPQEGEEYLTPWKVIPLCWK